MQTQIAEAQLAPVDVNSKEVRLFKVGINETLEESYALDAEALQSCLVARSRWNVRVQFDLEHRSTLDKNTSPQYLGDSMGWADLEGRKGELWAVRLEFTAEGLTRIRNKTQTYLSPTFYWDIRNGIYGQGRYIREIFNVALTALPQTLGAQQLMAASASLASSSLTASERRICREMKCPEHAYAQLKRRRSLGAEVVLPEDEEEIRVRRINVVQNIPTEQAERLTLIARLISLGSETPTTAYQPMTDASSPIPCDRLQREPIESLRTRVQALADYSAGQFGLTPNQLKICAETGCNPADYAALQATRNRS